MGHEGTPQPIASKPFDNLLRQLADESFRKLLSGDKMIAYFERAQPYVNLQPGFNYNPVPTPSRLHLSREADGIRELVVFSFIFMEKDRRQANYLTERYADQQTWMGVTSAS